MEQERVSVFVPRGTGGEEPNLLICVNGRSYLLPRGKQSRVPPEVAYELERARRAQEQQDERIQLLADRGGD